MTDVILSSFISLFALFGKEEQVDESRAKEMLVSYLRRHFGIRNIDLYLDLYSDMRMASEMTDERGNSHLHLLYITQQDSHQRGSVATVASHGVLWQRWHPGTQHV